MATQTPIIVFYHSLFYFGDPPELWTPALNIAQEAMDAFNASGLTDSASEFIVGVNGGKESEMIAQMMMPAKAKLVFHGLESKAENLTIVEVEKWARNNPQRAFICYAHIKGATHKLGDPYGDNVSAPWRRAMLRYLVMGWRNCVTALEAGNDIACCHWLWNMADGTQHIPAGNFLWTTSDFVRRLPSIYLRERIKTSGIAAAESRYEAEVFWGNGPRPMVYQFLPNGGEGIP